MREDHVNRLARQLDSDLHEEKLAAVTELARFAESGYSHALDRLCAHNNAIVVEPLIKLLDHFKYYEDSRGPILNAIAEIALPGSFWVFEREIRTGSVENAVLALARGNFRDLTAIRCLIEGFLHTNWESKAARSALSALVACGQTGVNELSAALDADGKFNGNFRRDALEFLAAQGETKYTNLLIRLATEGNDVSLRQVQVHMGGGSTSWEYVPENYHPREFRGSKAKWAVQQLLSLLKTSASKFPSEELQRLAALRKSIYHSYVDHPESTDVWVDSSEEIDCSQIRALAVKEIERRQSH
jgi:hypothetical protein